MSEAPPQPKDALEPDDYQRFMYACAHERRSPSTQRLIDAASYGWVYQFVHDHGADAESPPEPGDGWLDVHDASPRRLSEYFGRVSIRVRNTDAFDYATSLDAYFDELARAREFPKTL